MTYVLKISNAQGKVIRELYARDITHAWAIRRNQSLRVAGTRIKIERI